MSKLNFNRFFLTPFLVGVMLLSVYTPLQASADFEINNLEFASGNAAVDGSLVAFTVDEFAQGGTDLNGDGDAGYNDPFQDEYSDDSVLHIYDSSTGVITNLGISIFEFPFIDDNLVISYVYEPDQGNTDLNGDTGMLKMKFYI
ncbi:MAG: hypothetical protein OER82_09785 [Nitrosopumilus sp.]|nr:hypothetical protein [Nitrosopumilus sp.]